MQNAIASVAQALYWFMHTKGVQTPDDVIGNTFCYWVRMEEVDPDLTAAVRQQLTGSMPPFVQAQARLNARLISRVARSLDEMAARHDEETKNLRDSAPDN